MTHDDLRALAMTVLRRPRYNMSRRESQAGFSCGVILSEIACAANDCPDAIGWSYGHSVMIECKVSRSDFLADAKKPQRLAGTGVGEFRFFMVPKDLLEKQELPPDWGLLEVEGRSVRMTVECPRRTLDLPAHLDEKRMLLSTIRRIRTREFLIIQREEDYDTRLENARLRGALRAHTEQP